MRTIIRTLLTILASFVCAITVMPVFAANADVVLYNDIDFQGEALAASQPIYDMSATNYNDKASSIVVRDQRWQFCTDANFQGNCVNLDPGNYSWVENVGIPNDSISSIRPF